MSTATDLVTDDQIRRRAVERWQVAEANVSTYVERHGYDAAGATTWFVLSVRRGKLDDWHTAGRRRTRADLLAMVESRPSIFAAF